MAYKKTTYNRKTLLFASKKSNSRNKKLRLGNSSFRRRMVIFAFLFGIIGVIALWRIFAATTAPTSADEIVLDYRVEAGIMIKRAGGLQPMEYSTQPIKTRILGDGTIYCGGATTDKLKEGKLTRVEVQSYYDQVNRTGVGRLANDIAPAGTKAFAADYTGIVIGSTTQAKRVDVHRGATKPAAFTKAEQVLAKACTKATKQILRSEARIPNAPKFVAAASSLIDKTVALLFPKAYAAANIQQLELDMYNLTNQHRASVGLNTLANKKCLSDTARNWAVKMAAAGEVSHSSLVNEVNKGCGSPAWTSIGENVGVGWNDAQPIFTAYMNSCGHMANIESRYPNCNYGRNTGPYTYTGVGFATSSDGRIFTSTIFMQCPSCGGGDPMTPPSTEVGMRGNVDANTCSTVAGWTYDTGNTARQAEIHVYISNPDGSDVEGINLGATNVFRPDVNAEFGITGNHGFSYAISPKWQGRAHKTVVYAIGSNGVNPIIGNSVVDNCGVATDSNVDIRDRCDVIAGWTYDRTNPGNSIEVHIYLKRLDGSGRTGYNTGATTTYRGDVNAAFGIVGDHGYSWQVPAEWARVPHIAEIYGIGPGGNNPLIGLTQVNDCSAIGNVDSNKCSSIQGWAIDRSKMDASTDVHIYISNLDGSGTEGINIGATNVFRPDVNSAYGVNGNHGFSYTVSPQWANKAHKAAVYSIGNGGNTLIGNTSCSF